MFRRNLFDEDEILITPAFSEIFYENSTRVQIDDGNCISIIFREGHSQLLFHRVI